MQDIVSIKMRIIWFDVWNKTGSCYEGVKAACEYLEKEMKQK